MRAMRDEVHYGDRVVRCYADRPEHVDQMLRAAAAQRPEAIALVEGSRRVTYAELDAAVACVAGNLRNCGIAQGDRVALILGNRIEFIEATFAVARLGAISVPINIRQRRPENEYVLRHSGATAVIFEAELASEMPDASAAPELRHRFAIGGTVSGDGSYVDLQRPIGSVPADVAIAEEDTFCILYTSGTTGRPKGAMLTHLGVIHSCLHFVEGWGLGPSDVSILAVPASHVTGSVAVILPMVLVAGRTVVMPTFKAHAYLELTAAERVTHTIIVPAMYNLCLLDPDFDRFDLSAWRIGGFGGAPMPEAAIKRLAEKLPNMALCNAYGATESTSPTTMMPLRQGLAHAESVGTVVPCGEVRIMDERGREVPRGHAGEIWIAGPMVVPGYWDNPEANQANFTGGYWKSGDIGSIDNEGYVRVFDRKKDMINRAGFKVYSAEVENMLSHHPGIVEVAIVGRPDDVLGERVQAFIVRKSTDVTEADIRAFCLSRMSDYKVPDRITFLPDALPRNANGKVLKPVLRQMIAAEVNAG